MSKCADPSSSRITIPSSNNIIEGTKAPISKPTLPAGVGGIDGNSKNEEIKFSNAPNSSVEVHITGSNNNRNLPKILMRNSFQHNFYGMYNKNIKDILFHNNNNNSIGTGDENNIDDERDHLISYDGKPYPVINPGGEGLSYENRDWKRDRGTTIRDDEEQRLRFPWKRIAYIGVLLVLGVTCAILALMKICGGAEWMNTATFSVILMGTAMLLPPGLYYGRILICICFRCKQYSLWDVPAGPFG